MKDKHIINLLEENKFKDLSPEDRALIEEHIADCADCRRGFEAAKVSGIILRTRAAETLEPAPFFEKRVMAAWRERQRAAIKPVADRIRQMWQDAKILVSGLATGVAVLTVLAVFSPQANSSLTAHAADYYSVESVVLGQQDATAEITDEQLLEEIYGSEDLEN
jgi:predicted anti-sigma-YlaC factor YlaD